MSLDKEFCKRIGNLEHLPSLEPDKGDPFFEAVSRRIEDGKLQVQPPTSDNMDNSASTDKVDGRDTGHFNDKKHLLDILDVKDAFINQQRATINKQAESFEKIRKALAIHAIKSESRRKVIAKQAKEIAELKKINAGYSDRVAKLREDKA